MDVVKNLFVVLDVDCDDRVSKQELINYCKKHYLPFTDDQIEEMFFEATYGRGIIHEH